MTLWLKSVYAPAGGSPALSLETDGTDYALYGYDKFNRLNSYTNGVTTNHIWDGSDMVMESNGTDVNKYCRGATGLAYVGISGAIRYYHKDEHGNVAALTDNSGAVIKTSRYDAFGNPTEPQSSIYAPFGYCGEYTDEETGLIYLRNRYYSPSIGRFFTEAPIRDGFNWYAYCENNPISFKDMFGLKPTGTSIYRGGNYSELDAKIIQMRLNDLGYTDSNGKALKVDGSIGPATTYAIKNFQRDNNLKVDGCVGDITWTQLGLILDTDVTEKLYNTTIKKLGENAVAYGISQESSYAEKLLFFYNLVRNRGPLDLKQLPEWKSAYFIFDGHIVREDAPGNIAYGIAGNVMGFSDNTLYYAAGYAQQRAGTSLPEWSENFYGDDPYDQFCIALGISYAKKRG